MLTNMLDYYYSIDEADAFETLFKGLYDHFTNVMLQIKEQLSRYLKDTRLDQKENLKKFVVIFKGFEDYFVEEL